MWRGGEDRGKINNDKYRPITVLNNSSHTRGLRGSNTDDNYNNNNNNNAQTRKKRTVWIMDPVLWKGELDLFCRGTFKAAPHLPGKQDGGIVTEKSLSAELSRD